LLESFAAYWTSVDTTAGRCAAWHAGVYLHI